MPAILKRRSRVQPTGKAGPSGEAGAASSASDLDVAYDVLEEQAMLEALSADDAIGDDVILELGRALSLEARAAVRKACEAVVATPAMMGELARAQQPQSCACA